MSSRNQINMKEFVSLAKKYLDASEIKNIVEIGSLNGEDSVYFKTQFPNANVFCIEGLPDNYNQYLKELTTVTPINADIVTGKQIGRAHV